VLHGKFYSVILLTRVPKFDLTMWHMIGNYQQLMWVHIYSNKTNFKSIKFVFLNVKFIISVFRILICLNADPDPGFYLNADPDPTFGVRILDLKNRRKKIENLDIFFSSAF